jgi:hypothetical protein
MEPMNIPMIERRSHITLVRTPERRYQVANELEMPFNRYDELNKALDELKGRVTWLERQVTLTLGGVLLTLLTALWNALHK